MAEDKVHLAVIFLAEFLGTGTLMFHGCIGAYATLPLFQTVIPAVIFAFTILMIVQCIGHISGAHLNPAVTIAALIMRKITIVQCCVYMVAEFTGALAGTAIVWLLVPDVPDRLCVTEMNPVLTSAQGLVIEFIFSCFLVFSCCSFWDRRNEKYQDSLAIKFSLLLLGIFLAAGALTGPSLNTARTLAPAIMNNSFPDHHWIYWVGPNLAAVFGTGLYKFVFSEKDSEMPKSLLGS